MDSIIIASVSGLFALGGVIVSGWVQYKNQKQQNQFQLETEYLKIKESRRGEILAQCITCHKLLSEIQREFSITNIVMFRTENLTVIELDEKFRKQRARIDETIAFFELYNQPVAKNVKIILKPMFEFWFNFRLMLERERNGELMQPSSDADVNAHIAAEELSNAILHVQYGLAQTAQEFI